jgi:hypothetical protein
MRLSTPTGEIRNRPELEDHEESRRDRLDEFRQDY